MRKLSVDGREFTWSGRILQVAGERDCHRCVRLRVWGAGKNSRALQADLLSRAVLPWGCATDSQYPHPADVRKVIEYALSRGWAPVPAGGTFFLSEAEHGSAFESDRFLLTDRLRDAAAPDPTTRVLRALDESRTGAPGTGAQLSSEDRPGSTAPAQDRGSPEL
ncbi:hypothetical protein AB0939_18825 [Streptomyces sp. NPDC006990]|uniref:hypothetical protein n=1 Tax=unclassified Streptomyces TaxID=2593676 RepID=UPI0034519736